MKKSLLILSIILVCAVAAIAVIELTGGVSKKEKDKVEETVVTEKQPLKDPDTIYVLFIGNSYIKRYNMPLKFRELCRKAGIKAEVQVFAYDGAYLRDFLRFRHVPNTLRKGRYDIVILQEESHCVRTDTAATAAVVSELMREAKEGTRFFLYETMSYKGKPEEQYLFTEAYENIAKVTGAGLLPVGRDFWKYAEEHPGIKMFDDGQHPSVTGYNLVAQSIFNNLKEELIEINVKK